MARAPCTIERPEIRPDDTSSGRGGWIVTVYNNEYNTYDEVIMILMIATECTPDEAYIETWEIDKLGSSVVHISGEEECQRVAQVISTIGIRAEVSPEG